MPARRRRPGKNKRNRAFYYESFTFSLSIGGVTTITVGTLAERPHRCNFRPLSMKISATGAYVPGTASTPGYYAPVGIQAWFMEGQAKNATSGIKTLSQNPKTITVRYPRSADWLSYDLDESTGVAQIEAVCIGPAGTATGYVRGTVTMKIALQPEIVAAGCPKFLTDDKPPSPPLSWADEVDLEIPLGTL